MANELIYSGKGDWRVTSMIVNGFIVEELVDDASLFELTIRVGDIRGTGTATFKIPRVDWDDPMAAVGSETTSVSNTDIGSGNITVTVGRQALARELGMLLRMTGAPGALADELVIARSMVQAAGMRHADMLCANFNDGSITQIAGTTATDISVDTIFDGLFLLNTARAKPGPMGFHCVLHPTQWNHLQGDMRGEAGALQFQQATAEMIKAKPAGFKGSWLGINFYDNDSCPTSGADAYGSLYADLGFVRAEGTRPPANGTDSNPVVIPESFIYVEFEDDARKASKAIVGNAFMGVAIGDVNRIVQIVGNKA